MAQIAPAQQALPVLAHLRDGDTYTRLAAGFAVGTTTAWRYVREGVDLLAALADDVHAAVKRASRLAYTVLDGTLIPIDRPPRRAAVLGRAHQARAGMAGAFRWSRSSRWKIARRANQTRIMIPAGRRYSSASTVPTKE